MKLYYFPGAPSPRKVGMVIAEKGLEIPTEILNIRAGEHRTGDYATVNPNVTVPALELDDGTCLTESLAIVYYLEQLQPEPNLMGRAAKERALVLMWHDIATLEGYLSIQERFRNSETFPAGRALPGPTGYERIPALVERGEKRIQAFFDKLDLRLAESEYLAGDRYTYADIAAHVYRWFAHWVTKEDPAAHREHLRRWVEAIDARPAVASLDA